MAFFKSILTILSAHNHKHATWEVSLVFFKYCMRSLLCLSSELQGVKTQSFSLMLLTEKATNGVVGNFPYMHSSSHHLEIFITFWLCLKKFTLQMKFNLSFFFFSFLKFVSVIKAWRGFSTLLFSANENQSLNIIHHMNEDRGVLYTMLNSREIFALQNKILHAFFER